VSLFLRICDDKSRSDNTTGQTIQCYKYYIRNFATDTFKYISCLFIFYKCQL